MILIEPSDRSNPQLTTFQILSTISTHASSTTLVLLPGIQYYTGQYFDIPAITRHAHSHGIAIGWDCAHAAGNVDLRLHDWDVDFAAWCTYKYLNAGPGAIAGLFVHRRHGLVNMDASASPDPETTNSKSSNNRFRPRLTGWWGAEKSTRFQMNNDIFHPRPGAAGYQLSNPSALDLTSLTASLQVFSLTTMPDLRAKSLRLTAYLERLLLSDPLYSEGHYRIITPFDPAARGAQLSIRLDEGLLEGVMRWLEREGVVVDERKPDVVRVAPAPLFNTFVDCWGFVEVWRGAVGDAMRERERDRKRTGEVARKEVG